MICNDAIAAGPIVSQHIKAPTAIGGMPREQLDTELIKGIDSFEAGSFSADEVEQLMEEVFSANIKGKINSML